MLTPLICCHCITEDQNLSFLVVKIDGSSANELQWNDAGAAALAARLGAKVVLAGKVPGTPWQVFGDPQLTREVMKMDLDAMPWKESILLDLGSTKKEE